MFYIETNGIKDELPFEEKSNAMQTARNIANLQETKQVRVLSSDDKCLLNIEK